MKFVALLFLTLALSLSAFAQSKNSLQKAEQFTATTLGGNVISLEELSGKVVFLTFWGTYCAICVSEIPELNKMAADYTDKNVVFLAVSVEKDAKIKKFVKEKPFNFTQIADGFEIVAKFAEKHPSGNIMMPTPTHFIINQNGEVELKIVGRDKSNKLEETLNKLLGS